MFSRQFELCYFKFARDASSKRKHLIEFQAAMLLLTLKSGHPIEYNRTLFECHHCHVRTSSSCHCYVVTCSFKHSFLLCYNTSSNWSSLLVLSRWFSTATNYVFEYLLVFVNCWLKQFAQAYLIVKDVNTSFVPSQHLTETWNHSKIFHVVK